MEGGSDLCLQRSALRKYLRHVYSRLPDRESRLQGHEASGRVAARRRDLQVLGGLGVLAGHCGESSPAKSSTPCRARRAPSSCRTRRGNGISTQAIVGWTGEPRAMHVCSARTQPLAGNHRAGLRTPDAPNCTWTHSCQGIAVPEETKLRIKRSSL